MLGVKTFLVYFSIVQFVFILFCKNTYKYLFTLKSTNNETVRRPETCKA